MDIFIIDLNNINLDDTDYDENDLDTIILVRLLAWHIKFENAKPLKKRYDANSVVSKSWWNFCMSEDEKKEIEPIFTE